MKKNTVKAFTLVEMLIVIVIIGILIAALLPRMQAAQGRARDVSRKTALSQIQSAIVVSQGDKGAWPGMTKNNDGVEGSAIEGLDIKAIEKQLSAAGLNGIPEDPLNATFGGLGSTEQEAGQYRYMVLPRNGTPAGGFILMAKTEVEGGSNWVYCNDGDTPPSTAEGGLIKPQTTEGETAADTTDLTEITPCSSISKAGEGETCGKQTDGSCRYDNDSQLRYMITY